MKLTAAQRYALGVIRDGGGVVGKTAPNGNTCNALRRKGLIDGRGWQSQPYVLTEAGEHAYEVTR